MKGKILPKRRNLRERPREDVNTGWVVCNEVFFKKKTVLKSLNETFLNNSLNYKIKNSKKTIKKLNHIKVKTKRNNKL